MKIYVGSSDPYRDKKKYHMAGFTNELGQVSALCFKRPRPINLKIALWTLRREAVTCAACIKKLKEPVE